MDSCLIEIVFRGKKTNNGMPMLQCCKKPTQISVVSGSRNQFRTYAT